MKRKETNSKCILRVPIIDPKQKLIQKCREKRDILNIMGIASEEDVFEVAYYYGYKTRELYNLTGFNAISKKDPYHHKNWKFFANVCNLCLKNKWDFNIYIDSQFDRAEYWENSDGRIFPQQLCSERAIAHYKRYFKGKVEEHEADGTTFKAATIKSIDEDILKSLIQDCKLIKTGMKFFKANSTDLEKKVTILFDNWLSLSAYYISTCDWLLEILEAYCEDTKNADTLKTLEKVKKINSSKKMKDTTKYIFDKIEKKLNILETPTKDQLENLLK